MTDITILQLYAILGLCALALIGWFMMWLSERPGEFQTDQQKAYVLSKQWKGEYGPEARRLVSEYRNTGNAINFLLLTALVAVIVTSYLLR